MTQKEAYIRGFCKAAEAHGIAPGQLVKWAQNAELMNPMLIAGLAAGSAPGIPLGALSGKISQMTGGDRKRNALVGAGAGAAPGALMSAGMLYRMGGLKALKEETEGFSPKEKAIVLLTLASPTISGALVGGLSGALFGKKKKGLIHDIRRKLSRALAD